MAGIDDNDFDVTPFKNRLDGYARANYKSFRNFEEKCGLKHSGLSTIGKQGPTLSYLAKIADAIPELNMNWLITGKGPMTSESQAVVSEAPMVNINQVSTINIGNWNELIQLMNSQK